MATIRSQVSINSNLLSNCSNDRFGLNSTILKALTLLMIFIALQLFSDYSTKRVLGYIIITGLISFVVLGLTIEG